MNLMQVNQCVVNLIQCSDCVLHAQVLFEIYNMLIIDQGTR